MISRYFFDNSNKSEWTYDDPNKETKMSKFNIDDPFVSRYDKTQFIQLCYTDVEEDGKKIIEIWYHNGYIETIEDTEENRKKVYAAMLNQMSALIENDKYQIPNLKELLKHKDIVKIPGKNNISGYWAIIEYGTDILFCLWLLRNTCWIPLFICPECNCVLTTLLRYRAAIDSYNETQSRDKFYIEHINALEKLDFSRDELFSGLCDETKEYLKSLTDSVKINPNSVRRMSEDELRTILGNSSISGQKILDRKLN